MKTEMNEEEITKLALKRRNRRVLLAVLLALSLMAAASLWIVYQMEKAEAHARYMGIKNVSAERVAKIIRGAEMNANNIFEEVGKSLDSPEAVINALRSKANLNLDVRGYFAAFMPNYFPEKGTWFEPYIYQPEYGGFEFRQVGSARHNYTKSPWFVRAQQSGASFWSDPYYYYDGTSVSGYYCTFVKPVYDEKGNLACICGADIKFEWLAKEMEWIDEVSKNNKLLNLYQPMTEFEFRTVILNKDGTCLVQPGDDPITITDEGMLKDLMQKKSGIIDMDIDGTPCTVYYSPIEFIDWTVAVITPVQDILKPMLPTALFLFVTMLAGMFIVWIVCKIK